MSDLTRDELIREALHRATRQHNSRHGSTHDPLAHAGRSPFKGSGRVSRARLAALTPDEQHTEATARLRDFLGTVTAEALGGRAMSARKGLEGVRRQLQEAQATFTGGAGEALLADPRTAPDGRPRTPVESFRVGADNLWRAFAAHQYTAAAVFAADLIRRAGQLAR